MSIRILIPRLRLPTSIARPRRFVWASLCIALWGTAYTFFGAGGYVGVARARIEIEQLETRVAQAETANSALTREIHDLRHNPQVIERLAREDLYLVRPNERVFLLPPIEDGTPSSLIDRSATPESDASSDSRGGQSEPERR